MYSLKYYLKHPDNFILSIIYECSHRWLLNWMSDELYLKMLYRVRLWKKLNLSNPITYNEKLQWMKVYDHNPLYTKMADKYLVKEYIWELMWKEYIIPTYWIRNTFDEIERNKLPNEFVLKCTHDSWSIVICKDKNNFDKVSAKKKLEKSLKKNCFNQDREWVYKDIKPRILAEKYIDSLGTPDSIEYKLTCFDWVAKLITLCRWIAHDTLDKRFNDFYDRDLNPLDFYVFYKNSPKKIPIPKEINEIIKFCEKVSKGIPCVRIDVYLLDWQIYFWEATFYTRSWFCVFTPEKWDKILWDWIKLPKINK